MTTDWYAPIRAYCERAGPEFWAEPVNALSNAGFILAAMAGVIRARTVAPPDRAGLALGLLIGVIGIGSFLFHTLAVYGAMLADVIPIAVFIHVYLAVALHRFVRLPMLHACAATAGFALFAFALTPVIDGLTGQDIARLTDGSVDYAPAVLALFAVAWAAHGRPEARFVGTGRRLAGIGVLFLMSLAARTADQPACAILPIGTHALWHILNAGVLYALVATAIRHRAIAG